MKKLNAYLTEKLKIGKGTKDLTYEFEQDIDYLIIEECNIKFIIEWCNDDLNKLPLKITNKNKSHLQFPKSYIMNLSIGPNVRLSNQFLLIFDSRPDSRKLDTLSYDEAVFIQFTRIDDSGVYQAFVRHSEYTTREFRKDSLENILRKIQEYLKKEKVFQ